MGRILTGRTRAPGVVCAGAAFDARDFLNRLSSHLTLHAPVDTAGAARTSPTAAP